MTRFYNKILNTPETFVPFDNILNAVTTMDTANEATFVCGPLVSQSWTAGNKEITGIELVYSIITSNANSVVDISLRNVTSSAGQAAPDTTPLAVWSGSWTGFSAAQVIQHLFTSSYSVAPETTLGLYFRYTTFQSSTAFNLQGYIPVFSSMTQNEVMTSLTTDGGSTWGQGTIFPQIRVLCSDGSILYFKNAYFGMGRTSNVSNDYNPNSTGTGDEGGDERGTLWIPKKTYDLMGYNIYGRATNVSSSLECVLYRDTTVLISQSISDSEILRPNDDHAWGLQFDTPIRVYPGDNIRLTQKATNLTVRNFTIYFENEYEKKLYYDGEDVSLTNRIDEGAWNTPPGATASVWPVQFYGYEVTGSALLSGSSTISGSVSLNGQPVENATIRLLHQNTNTIMVTESAANGIYQFSNISASNYHVMVEHQSGSQKYNALSSWNIQPQ